MSNSCIMSFPDKHKVTVFSCEKWFRMFRIAYLFITSSLSWFPIKMPLVGLINLQSIKQSINKLYIRHYLGKDEGGWFLEQLRFSNKLLEAPNCTYQFVVMQRMLNQKNKKKCWQGGWLYSQQQNYIQTHAVLSVTISIFYPTWSKTSIRMDWKRTNHITSKPHGPPLSSCQSYHSTQFQGDPDRSTHCNSCLFPGSTCGTYAFIAEHRSECCILKP